MLPLSSLRPRWVFPTLDSYVANGNKILVYDDVYCGSDYLKAVMEGRIKPDDVMIQISLDGAQLFQNKQSDSWMYYICIFHNLSPD